MLFKVEGLWKMAIFLNFVKNPKNTYSYANFIVDSISENHMHVSIFKLEIFTFL